MGLLFYVLKSELYVFLKVNRKVQLPEIKVCPHGITELIKPLRMEKLAESCQQLATHVKVLHVHSALNDITRFIYIYVYFLTVNKC
jgi:hypothetical protein